MEGAPILVSYLGFFFQAWKNGYKLGWIFYRMVEVHGKEVALSFFADAETSCYPLMWSATHAGAGTPFLLTIVNRSFSDWVFEKNPTEEVFVRNVLVHAKKLRASKKMWETAQKGCSKDLQRREWEALAELGGHVVHIKETHHNYYTKRGRITGKGRSVKK